MGLFGRKIKDGVRGEARVEWMELTEWPARQVNKHNRKHRFRLIVSVPGKQPYEVWHVETVKATKSPTVGEVIPVIVSQSEPDRLKIAWDDIPDVMERYGPAMDAMRRGETEVASRLVAEQLRGIELKSPAPPPDTPPTGNVVEERLDQLERLAKLHDSGALSEAEFEAEKTRILGGG